MNKQEEMSNFFNEIKTFFGEQGFLVSQENQDGSIWSLSTALIKIDNDPQEEISVIFKTHSNYLYLTIRLAYPVEPDKVSETLKILNKLNGQQAAGCFFFNESTGTVDLSDGFFFLGCEADANAFSQTLASLQNLAETFFPPIQGFLVGEKDEQDVYDQILNTAKGAILYEHRKEETWN